MNRQPSGIGWGGRLAGVAATAALITLMVGISEWSGEREVIFPEIAAIAVGALVAPRLTWRTDKPRLWLGIMACALLGVGIVVLCPGPVWVQMALGYLLAQVVLVLSGTGFAPMISAMVLPILLQTRSVVYLASAAGFTALILGVRLLLEHFGLREKEPFTPLPRPAWKQIAREIGLRTVPAAAIIWIAMTSGAWFAAAPPLLVAFTEFTHRESPAARRPVRAVALIALCALTGSVARELVMAGGCSLTLAALVTALVVLVWIFLSGMFLPPAGALGILAMLIPEWAVPSYPLQIAVGAAVYMSLALVLQRRLDPGEAGAKPE